MGTIVFTWEGWYRDQTFRYPHIRKFMLPVRFTYCSTAWESAINVLKCVSGRIPRDPEPG